MAALLVLLVFGLACNSLKDIAGGGANNTAANTANRTEPPANTVANSAPDTSTAPGSGIVSADDPADFTYTAEEIYKAYDADKSGDLDDKHVGKIVVVKGRFKEFDTKEKDTTGGYPARLQAGGTFDWVTCSVDEEHKDQFTKLKPDQMVTFKGMGEEFWIGGPHFKHCIVVPN